MRELRKAPAEARALSLRVSALVLAAGALLAAWAVPAYAAAPKAVDDTYSTTRGTALVTTAANGVLANDSDPDKDPITAQLVRAPTHGTLALNANGSFTYTPTGDFTGTDNFQYHARDASSNSNTATATITVTSPNVAPVAVNDSYSTAEDTTLNVSSSNGVLKNDTDSNGDPITATLSGNVSHGTLTLSATGSFTYTPVANYSGPDSFTYQASDGSLTSNTASVTITVTAVNDPPVAVNDSYSTPRGTPLVVAAKGVLTNDTDPDSPNLTAALASNPQHGTVVLSPTGAFTYTPAANYTGPDTFTYRANDGATNSNTATVSITVTPVNSAPVAVNDSYSTPRNTPLSVNAASGVLANDSDPDGNPLTTALASNPAHGTLTITSNGSFTYTPASGYTGPDAFTYRASDGSLTSNTATVSITVTTVNSPPIAANDAYTTNEDAPLIVPAKGVLANDSDPDNDSLTTILGANPSHGTLVLSPNGSFTYTPTTDYSGPDAFTYRASDGTLGSNFATVSITVSPINHAPAAADDTYSTTEDVALVVDAAKGVLANDTDRDGNPMTVGINTNPAHGTLVMNASGAFSYTPVQGYNGSDAFTYHASDGTLNSNTATVTITIARAPRVDLALALSAAPNPAALGAAATWTFAIKNNTSAVDVSGVTLTATFAGEVPFQFDAPSDPGCTFSIVGSTTQLSCTLQAVAGGMTRNLALTGHGNIAGDVFASAKVAVTGPTPIDETPANDTTTTALSVAQRVSSGPAQTISGVDARGIAAGDFNADGIADLAVATGATQGTLVFLSIPDPANASRRMLASTPITLDPSPSRAIAVADFNSDHNLDVVTAAAAGSPNRIYMNAGQASFTGANVGDPAEDSYGVAVGDVNGDALPDLVFANNGPTSVYLNRGSGVFELAAKLGTASSRGAVLVDLFGDALPELVLANASGDAAVYRNTAGAFTLELTLPTGPTTSVTAADLNGDKRADLIFGRDTSTLPATPSGEVWLNTSATSGSFFLSDQLGASLNSAVAAADIDLNGSIDVIVVNKTGAHQVYANSGNSSGTFNLFPQQVGVAGALAVATGKFSADDRLDVALAGPSGIAVFWNDGAGNLGGGDLTPPTITLVGSADMTVNVGDTYTDAGATAADALDGNLTTKIVTTNPVNTAQVGTYTVTYNVKDTSGNAATPATRTVTVKAVGGSTGGGGATGLEFVLGLALAIIAARLDRRPRGWRGDRLRS